MKSAVETAGDRIAELEQELKELRARYEQEPKNWRLGEEVGLATNRLVHAKREALIPEKAAAVQAMKAANLRDRNRRPLTGRDWEALLPAHCPGCEGWLPHAMGQKEPLPAIGYTRRIGELGAKCVHCHHEWKVTA